MSTISSTSILPEQEQFLFDCLQKFRPMILRLTQNMDTDDALQEASLIILEALRQLPAAHTNPVGFICMVLRNQLIIRYRQMQRAALPVISMDETLYEDGETTLADLLPSPSIVGENARLEALYEALHRLPTEEQTHLKQTYDLYSFTPRYPSGHRVRKARTARSLITMALRQLRQDRRLQQAIVPIGPA